MPFDFESLETQEVLARILSEPSISSQDIVNKLYPNKDNREKSDILTVVREFVENKKIKTDGKLPKLIHRLRFCWAVLRQADLILRKTKAGDFPDIINSGYLLNLFLDLFPSQTIHSCLLESLCLKLGIDKNGVFVSHYAAFLKQTKAKPLNISIKDSEGNLYVGNLQKLTYWILRKNRYQYVVLDEEGYIKINFPYLASYIGEELPKYLKSTDYQQSEQIREEIESQIDTWLNYCCLQGENLLSPPKEKKELVSFFLKDNKLTNKIFVTESTVDTKSKIHISELKLTISEYANENKKLESQIDLLKKQSVEMKVEVPKTLQHEDPAPIEPVSRDFLNFLRIIDSKYSIDVLESVSLGDDKSITIKNFLGHFFYSSRKNGLTLYPSVEEFNLNYEQSGLYNCVGFEILPGESKLVAVEKNGWAIKREERLFPIKKAIVREKM
jgi:hypothetical protein